MLMDWHKIEMYHQAHYQELICEANKARLLREALAGSDPRPHLFCRFLHWLGHRLEAWGQRLKQRFAVDRRIESFPATDQCQ